jgi:hypothetical protein
MSVSVEIAGRRSDAFKPPLVADMIVRAELYADGASQERRRRPVARD